MGLPQEPLTQPPSTTTTNNSQKGTPATSLPPAALELATKLFDYARTGQTGALQQYLTAGIPPNLTNHAGDTLLMLAAYHGHEDTVRILLSKSADPNVLNDRGQSVIAGAVFKGYEGVVRLLFEGGADIRRGQPSAVDSARMFKQEAMLELFGVEEGGERGSRPWDDNGRP